MPTHRHKWLNELTVVAVFFAIVAIGLIVTLFSLDLVPESSLQGDVVQARKAPTVEEYRSEARDVLSPFLEQARMIGSDQAAYDETVFLGLVDKTQERLLRLIVPVQGQEAHLSFVLLLEQWRRAINGSVSDQAQAPDNTQKVIAANPWLMVE